MATEASWEKYKKLQKKKKPSTKKYNICKKCGRSRAYLRDFGLCRICFRNLAHKGDIPGVLKSSW